MITFAPKQFGKLTFKLSQVVEHSNSLLYNKHSSDKDLCNQQTALHTVIRSTEYYYVE